MKADIADLIAEMLLSEDPDLTNRLDDQAEALTELECIFPLIGQWIAELGAEHLLSIFCLDDRRFAEYFPQMASMTAPERTLLLDTFKTHMEHCAHCWLRRGYDLELNAQVAQRLRQNRSCSLVQVSADEDDQQQEDEHLNHKSTKSASQVAFTKLTFTKRLRSRFTPRNRNFQET
jgi:hypothetical protein